MRDPNKVYCWLAQTHTSIFSDWDHTSPLSNMMCMYTNTNMAFMFTQAKQIYCSDPTKLDVRYLGKKVPVYTMQDLPDGAVLINSKYDTYFDLFNNGLDISEHEIIKIKKLLFAKYNTTCTVNPVTCITEKKLNQLEIGLHMITLTRGLLGVKKILGVRGEYARFRGMIGLGSKRADDYTFAATVYKEIKKDNSIPKIEYVRRLKHLTMINGVDKKHWRELFNLVIDNTITVRQLKKLIKNNYMK